MSNVFASRVIGAALAFVLFAGAAFAADEINVGPDGAAIHRYDPVAYFDPGHPTRGSDSLSAPYNGAVYWFSSQENLRKFMRNPEKYAPAYGGWCSYGVRVGKKLNIDPNAWKIIDGRLYMQLDLGTQKVWYKDWMKNIEIADRLWPSIQSTPADALGK